MATTIGELFDPRPDRWGLRGDVHLWADMREQFAAVPLPPTREALEAVLLAKFSECTGLAFDHPVDSVFLQKYAHGGMSSGHVHLPWWRDSALPMLLERSGLSAAAPGR